MSGLASSPQKRFYHIKPWRVFLQHLKDAVRTLAFLCSKASNKQVGDKIFVGADKANATLFQYLHKPAGVQGIPGQTIQLSHHQGVHPLFPDSLHNCGQAGTVWTDAVTYFGGFAHNGTAMSCRPMPQVVHLNC